MAEHVQVTFFTKQTRYSVPNAPFSVPTNVGSNELSSIINSLLVESSGYNSFQSIEFDFLIGNEFLRLPLNKYLEQKDISTETVVEIEYVEKHPAPAPEDSICHDDWVSAVQASARWILTGCYDNTLNIWSTDGEKMLTFPGHVGPIKAVCWLKNDDRPSFVSTSHDQNAMIWEWDANTNSIECISVCKGHERSVECVDVSDDSMKIATGSWDRVIRIWSTLPGQCDDFEEHTNSRKKLKTETGKSCRTISSVMGLVGHNEAVSAVQWTGRDELCSASWDHTIRLWNVELGGLKDQLVGNKNFFDMSYSPLNHLIISASADPHIRLWDFRAKGGYSVKCAFTSHTGWVNCVKWSPTNEHQFISGSQDWKLKEWDIRCPKAPLYDMCGHKANIMCCDWSNPNFILSGSADNQLKIYKCTQF